jgi:hypothetical protein
MEEFMYELVARDLICGSIHLGDVRITDIAPTCAVRRQAKDQKAGK